MSEQDFKDAMMRDPAMPEGAPPDDGTLRCPHCGGDLSMLVEQEPPEAGGMMGGGMGKMGQM